MTQDVGRDLLWNDPPSQLLSFRYRESGFATPAEMLEPKLPAEA